MKWCSSGMKNKLLEMDWSIEYEFSVSKYKIMEILLWLSVEVFCKGRKNYMKTKIVYFDVYKILTKLSSKRTISKNNVFLFTAT